MDNCIFCRIIKGEIPSLKILENDQFLAFLSISPLKQGHTLLIPKHHIPYLFDEDDEVLSKLLVVAKPIAEALKKAFHPKTGKVGVIVAGQGVSHTHLHLIPMDSEFDLDFKNAKHNVTQEEFELNQRNIVEYLTST